MSEKKKNSLLIVDDEKMTLNFLTHVLGSEYTIYSASTGENAIKIAREYLPDLILLDILMPGMDGYQTLSELRNCMETSRIPVIFTSGLSSTEDEEKGLSLGVVDYITKPFSGLIVKLRIQNQIQIINQLRIIEYLSMIDQLTKIHNRRSFDERLRMEWNQAIREQTTISLLMMDLDRFKNLNDTYGHQQGDIVLQTVAKIFPHSFSRPGDFVARWGGEEFVVLLPNTPSVGAKEIAEKIRTDVESVKIFCPNGSSIKITISIGVSTQLPVHDSPIDAFISNADKALYAAKEAGRNKVIHSCL